MTLKIGLLGCGGQALGHAGGYLRIPGEAQVTAVSDVVEGAALAMAQHVGGARAFGDFRELIAEADVDAVDICLPHHLHKDAIVAAAGAGKHVLCEKPLCLSEEEAAEVRAAVEEAGVLLMCAHNQLFSPPVAKAVELIGDGLLGKVYEVRTTDSYFNDFSPETMGWRASAKTSG